MTQLAQMMFRSRVVIRVRTAPPQIIDYSEKKGPRCVPITAVLGAAVMAENSVDFILRGGARVRARFSSSCPALAFYGGFYMVPSADGMICADRDTVRSRAGGECEIDKLRTLVAHPRR